MQNYPIIFRGCLLSVLCLALPAYHDFNTAWLKSEFFIFLGLMFLIVNGLFFYAFKNWRSALALRKYGITSLAVLLLIILTITGWYHSADIPTLAAMVLYFIVSLPIFAFIELICYFLEKQTLSQQK